METLKQEYEHALLHIGWPNPCGANRQAITDYVSVLKKEIAMLREFNETAMKMEQFVRGECNRLRGELAAKERKRRKKP